MLREISAKRFQELIDFELMESPELRMDIRFALLGAVVAAAGHVQTADGRPFTAVHFLEQLQKTLERHDALVLGDTSAEQALVKQDLEAMTFHVEAWVKGANRSLQEQGRGAPSTSHEPGASRRLLAQLRGGHTWQ